MTTVSAKVILDSISPEGLRLSSLELCYPRFIHPEFMTHRKKSKNAGSSRAVPVEELIRQILQDPAEPVSWGSAKRGMQAGPELTGWRRWLVRRAWHTAKWGAVICSRIALFAGAHKQVINRMLEPWSHITVIVSSTNWSNFFALRRHPDADPTMQALAEAIWEALEGSKPQLLQPGQWHLPYIRAEEMDQPVELLRKISAARCARVSYLTHDGKTPNIEADLKLFDRLAGSMPIHASPLEHQATPDKLWSRNRWAKPELHGNFDGWIQHRKLIPGEYQ